MNADGSPTTRLDAHSLEQRWQHAADLCGDGQVELLVWIGCVPHTVTDCLSAVRSVSDGSRTLRETARKLVRDVAVGAREQRAGDGVSARHAGVLLIDLLEREELGPADPWLVSAVVSGRPTIVWTKMSRLEAVEPLLGRARTLEVLEQVSVEGLVLVPGDAASVAIEAAIDPATREGDRTVVLCANFAGRAGDAATQVAAVDGGSERLHLATALAELRRANTTLGKSQRGKSMAAAAMLIQRTERNIAEQFERRERLDKDRRDEWITGLLEEIDGLKQIITEIEARRVWRLVAALERWRGRLRLVARR